MKKFSCILLISVMLFSMSVSAFASNTNTLSGTWYINSVNGLNSTFFGTQSINFTSNGKYYDGFYGRESTQLCYELADSTDYDFAYDGGWVNEGFRTVNFGTSPQTVSTSFYEWFVGNAEQIETPTCNGSICPAHDVNIDGVCDDCGMTLMSLSRSPVPPSVTGNNFNSALFYSGTLYKYTVYTSDDSYTIRGSVYGERYRADTEPSSVNVKVFESYDGLNWEQTYDGKSASNYPGEVGWELLSSSFSWYDDNGEQFFPVPLWAEVEQVTQGEMVALTTETVGTMKVLVVCGVGLMALLVGLSLFGKRSLLFLR